MLVPLNGGPADGSSVQVAGDPPRVRVIWCGARAVAGTFDAALFVGATFAVYRWLDERGAYEYVGATDDLAPFDEAPERCRACGAERLALYPLAMEWPAQCPECLAMTMWPVKVRGPQPGL